MERTRKVKGAELEKFCRRFFIKLGFKNSTLNFIAAGRNEYDVTAEKLVIHDDGTEETILYLIESSMVAALWPGHGEGDSLIVRKKESIGGIAFLPVLIFNLFTSGAGRCMGTVNMGDREIRNLLVFPQDIGINLLPFFLNRPFAIMMEDGVPVRKLAAEKMSNREKAPLAAAPELVKNGIHYLHKIEFGDHNIVRSLRNTLYFNFTVLLTYRNKFKQLH